MKIFKILILISIILFSACSDNNSEVNVKNDSTTIESKSKKDFNKNAFEFSNKNIETIAKPIFYTAIIKNSISEKEYLTEWLKDTDKEGFLNSIFDAIYSGKLIAENFNTLENMTIEEVKKFEKENKRKNIGQILFEEEWYFDKEKLKMYKKVKSIMMAYEIYNENNGITNRYRAGIKVYLK